MRGILANLKVNVEYALYHSRSSCAEEERKMGLLDFPCGWRDSSAEEDALTSVMELPEKRRGKALRGAGTLWRPSLLAITEDHATSVAASSPHPAAVVVVAKGGWAERWKGKRKAKRKPAATRAALRSVKDEYQHYAVVPAFSPTAFLF
ncbi:hypothetical protein Cni_G00576 [Canna indica]|uniref:Uncharacterized protein n=1 Tax=Canna indica TaxID=4628 RepID=A0AAQ3PZQ1_9LILI|nr:hypothetical protein Cni_G00576 [Canna indica]